MHRTAWLLLAWLPLMGCDEAAVLSAPSEVAEGDAASPEPTDAPSDGKQDAPDGTKPTTAPSSPAGPDFTLAPRDLDPVDEAVAACASGTLEPPLFERAYEARLCEEWTACDGSDCLEGHGGEVGRYDVDDFDVEAACTCIASAWSCETSYGASTEVRVVVPDLSCFEVY